LFGAAGSANFLSRTTAVLASAFFLTSVALTYFGTTHGKPQGGVMEQGVMEKAAPKASDVPGGSPATSVPPKDVPAAAPGSTAAPANAPAKNGEVPK
jgi:preprotein translocase subunit SecG